MRHTIQRIANCVAMRVKVLANHNKPTLFGKNGLSIKYFRIKAQLDTKLAAFQHHVTTKNAKHFRHKTDQSTKQGEQHETTIGRYSLPQS